MIPNIISNAAMGMIFLNIFNPASTAWSIPSSRLLVWKA